MDEPFSHPAGQPPVQHAVPAGGTGGNRWRPRPSRRALLAGAAVVAVVAGALLAVDQLGGASPQAAGSTAGTATTTVQTTDLRETTPVNGTVGFASPFSIVEPAGNPSAALTRDQQAVSSAQQGVASDQTGMAGTQASDAASLDNAQQSLKSAQATLTSDEAGLQNDQSTLAADQGKEANDCQGAAAAGSSPGAGTSGGGTPSSGGGGGGSSSGCAADQSKVASDQQKVGQDQQTVTKDRDTVTTDRSQVATAQQKATQDAAQAQAKLTADQSSLSDAQTAMATDSTAATSYGPDSKFTTLPVAGQVIDPGQPVWSVDGQPVLLLPEELTPWRAFWSGMSPGPDVAALNQALAKLGYGAGLAASDAFTPATATAIDRLQAAHGLAQTGELDLGSVVFSPTPLRVTTVHPLVGAGVNGGQPVLDVTSTTPVINVALPVNQSYLVKAGDAVTANLPDGSSASGTITAVGTVATAASSGSGGGGGGGGGDNQQPATIDVTVALDHASAAASLDQAPVTVNITNNTADHVLAVRTTALLALAGGGYALEVVDPGGTHHLVAVTTGIFDDQTGFVQVSGPGVTDGLKVVVPAS